MSSQSQSSANCFCSNSELLITTVYFIFSLSYRTIWPIRSIISGCLWFTTFTFRPTHNLTFLISFSAQPVTLSDTFHSLLRIRGGLAHDKSAETRYLIYTESVNEIRIGARDDMEMKFEELQRHQVLQSWMPFSATSFMKSVEHVLSSSLRAKMDESYTATIWILLQIGTSHQDNGSWQKSCVRSHPTYITWRVVRSSSTRPAT